MVMPETWVNIYLWIIIGWSLFDIFFFHLPPLSRIFRKSKSNDEYMKVVRRRLLIRNCCQLIIGFTAMLLFKRGILDGWTAFGFCGVLLIGEYVLFLLIKPPVRPLE
jgi:hypothetical protein